MSRLPNLAPLWLILIIPLLILAFPVLLVLGLIGGHLDEKKRQQGLIKLEEIIKAFWIPKKKYVFVRHATNHFVPALRQRLIEPYGKYIVYQTWDPAESRWDTNWSGFSASEKQTLEKYEDSLAFDVEPDYDDVVPLFITRIEPGTSKFSEHTFQVEVTYRDVPYSTNEGYFTEDQIIEKAVDYIKKSLSKHGIK